MAGLAGKSTKGVDADIVDYLTAVATYFNITIHVTSGYRSPDGQAKAMFNNWVNLKHGKVYKKTTLPEADRETLDGHWKTAHDKAASADQKKKAKAEFLTLAKERVGSKSRHTQGKAVDVAQSTITHAVYQAITMRLKEVKEGKRTDIYHFESSGAVPAADEATKAQWAKFKAAGPAKPTPPKPAPGHKHKGPIHHAAPPVMVKVDHHADTHIC